MSGFALELQSMRKPRGVSVSNTRLRRLLLVPPILLLAMVAATGAAASPPPPASGAVVGMLLLLAALPLIVAGCGSASAAKAVSGAHTTADVIRATERQRRRVLPAHDLDRASRLHASDFEPCARYRGQS
jgi:hypothetical protein